MKKKIKKVSQMINHQNQKNPRKREISKGKNLSKLEMQIFLGVGLDYPK